MDQLNRILRSGLYPLLACAVALPWLTLAGPSVAANRLANSSFEVGIDHRYAIGRWYVNGLPSAKLDSVEKVHGDVSMRIPMTRKGNAWPGSKGIEVRGGVGVRVEKGKTYTFSVYLKTDMPDPKAKLQISPNVPYEHRGRAIAEKKIALGRRTTPNGFEYPWKRHAITFTAKKSEPIFWVVAVDAKRAGSLWLDALQFEEGDVTDYKPMLDVEAGLIDSAHGHIHEPGEAPVVALNAYNDGTSPAKRQAKLRILNDVGTVVSEKTLGLTIAAQSRISKKISLDIGSVNGRYLAEITLPGAPPTYRQLTNFLVLPTPRPIVPRHSSFGAYITPSEEALRILSRAGFHWTATLTSANHLGTWARVERQRGKFRWQDADVDLFRRHGFEILLNMEGWIYPKWAEKLSIEEKTAAFARYVEASVEHYRGKIEHFTFADEIHNKVPGSHMLGKRRATWGSPKEYADWHRAAHTAARKANPDAKIVLNTQLGAFGPDHLFRYLSPDTIDILAGNYYPYPKSVRTLKRSADAAGIATVWAPGVAINTWPVYFLEGRPLNTESGRYLETMIRKIIRTFANGATVFFHYTGTYVGNTNVYSVFEHDSSLEAGGAQMGALAWLVDGFEQVRRVPVVRSSQIEAYRFDRRDGNSVFAVWSRLNSPDQSLIFKQEVEGTRVFDRRTTEISPSPDGSLDGLSVGEETRFVMVPTHDADTFERALSLSRFKVAALPSAKSIVREGNYAAVTEVELVQRKKKESRSLWYFNPKSGWQQLLKLAGNTNAALEVTEEGGIVRFAYDWNGKPHHLFLGDLVPELWGAQFWRSLPKSDRSDWQGGIVDGGDNAKRAVKATVAEAPPISVTPPPPAYVIDMEDGAWLAITTEGGQPNLRHPTYGAWKLFASTSESQRKSVSIRRYVHGGEPQERDIRVRFSVLGPSRN